jgi:dihydrofolate reductase
MRKITMLNRISIDGYFATNNPGTWGMDWFIMDPNVDAAAHKLNDPERKNKPDNVDTLILGEQTYLGFERSWVPHLSDPQAPAAMKSIAQELTNMKKIVFSKKLKRAEWENTELHDDDLPRVVKELKRQEGGDIMIMGSGTVVQQLTREHLIDYYAFIVSPVIAGGGKFLFKDVQQLGLTLISAQSFDSGNVLLYYRAGQSV